MVNVFRLCSIMNLLYGQVAGDLATCSWLWRIMSPPHFRLVNTLPSPLPPYCTTNNVLPPCCDICTCLHLTTEL